MAAPDESERTEKPFYERGSFRAAVAVVGLVGAVWALLGAPKPWEVATEFAANPLPFRNTEIILDASSRMGAPFGSATKLQIAAEAVDRAAAGSGEHVGLALRRVGGACDEPSEPLVGFDDHQFDEVTKAAGELEPGGRANLSLAVQSAIGDFSGEAFHRPGAENQILIFAGGGDQCGDQTGREIRNQLKQANIHPEFHVYAINVSKKELKSLKTMKRELEQVAPVELDQADSVQQLYEAVREDTGGSGGQAGSVPQSGGGQGAGAGSEGNGAPASASEAGGGESWSAPAPGLLEEEPAEPIEPSEAEKEEEREKAEEREQEEKEAKEKEKEAEEDLDLESAEEAPIEESGGGGGGGGSIEESQPLTPPPKSLPRLRW